MTVGSEALAALLKGNAGFFRRGLNNSKTVSDHPLLQESREEGATDYYTIATPFSDEKIPDHEKDGMMASGERTIHRALAIGDRCFASYSKAACGRLQSLNQGTGCIICLGRLFRTQCRRAGPERSSGSAICAVPHRLPKHRKARVLFTLNDYFEVTAGAVIAYGGEVLRFIGDAVLAIFPIDDSVTAEAAAKAAVAALYQADKRLIAVNERRQNKENPSIAFGAGLHVGKVLYGISVHRNASNLASLVPPRTKPHVLSP